MARILVVDDEKVMVKGLRFNLENEGYEVDIGYDGRQAVELARANDYDLILLDLMMPEIDGLEACMQIRTFSTVPIIMLTARGTDTDKLLGFEYGADDYITKPFNVLEVKARVKALLRRSATTRRQEADDDLITRGPLQLDAAGRSLRRQGVRPAGAAHAPPRPRLQPGAAARPRLGVLLHRRLPHRGRPCPPPS